MALYRYYRLLNHEPQTAGNYYRCGEIEMRASIGGANLCTGGTPFGNGDYYAASRAFDGSIVANAGDWAGNPGDGRTVGYDFGADTTVNIVRVQNSDSSNGAEQNQHLKVFDIQGSANNVDWTTLLVVSNHPAAASAYVDYSVATYGISGTVRDESGTPCARTVRLYRRDTGTLLAETTSHATTGAYSFTTAYAAECYVVSLDATAAPDFNALILDKITPS